MDNVYHDGWIGSIYIWRIAKPFTKWPEAGMRYPGVSFGCGSERTAISTRWLIPHHLEHLLGGHRVAPTCGP